MEIQDFFKDFEKGELKEEFKRERKIEFRKWIREHRSGKGYAAGELTKEFLEKRARTKQ